MWSTFIKKDIILADYNFQWIRPLLYANFDIQFSRITMVIFKKWLSYWYRTNDRHSWNMYTLSLNTHPFSNYRFSCLSTFHNKRYEKNGTRREMIWHKYIQWNCLSMVPMLWYISNVMMSKSIFPSNIILITFPCYNIIPQSLF